MLKTSVTALLSAAIALASAASAQDIPAVPASAVPIIHTAPAEPGWSGDRVGDPGPVSIPYADAAFDALEAGDIARAEAAFIKAVRRNPFDPAAHFYLGATRMDLGNSEGARQHLELAAKKMPRHPDPKSRLGVTYAKLGDVMGANAQRAALVKLSDSCNGVCRLAPYIARGIAMIDDALASPPDQG